MRPIFLTYLLLTIFLKAEAQNHAIVKATILDTVSGKPVPLATVSILKIRDTSLIAYTVTDKNGAFVLHNPGLEPSRLLISHVGYNSLHININLKKDEVLDLGKLYFTAKTLQEVVIKGERIPVMIKKDTIEFDAEAFKTRPNAMVEDLLKKLPGIEVDRDGHITVNGKDISKIKVNGKDFFVNDPTIATRNLEANMIAKVQVYDDRENDPDHLVPDYQVKKIINLKFKKSFAKGILSTIGAGGGTQDRYEAAGFLAKFQDDLQLSAKVDAGNLNNTGTFLGNYGGFTNLGYGSTGISTANTGNFDLTKDITKKLKLHIEYRYSNGANVNNSNSKVQQNINDTIISTLTQKIARQTTNNQTLHAETEWKPDSLTIIKYVPDVEYNYTNGITNSSSITSNTFVPLVNTNISSDHSNSNGLQYRHSLSYYRKLSKKGASITVSNTFSAQPQNSFDLNNNDLASFVAALASDTLARLAKNKSNDLSEGINAAWHYPITKKLFADVGFTGLHDQNSGELITYDEDLKTGLYNIFLQNQSSNLVRTLWGELISPQLTYNFTGNIYIKAGLVGLSQQIGNHFNSYTSDLNQNFNYLFPSAEVHVEAFTLSYSENVQQPSINNLQPITIVYSPLYTFIGNPGLKPTYFHNINFHFNKNNFEKHLYINVLSGVVIEKNTVVNEQFISAEGASVATPINRNGRFTAQFEASLSKQFKKTDKWELFITSNMNASAGHNFFIVNQQNGYQNTQNVTFNQTLQASWNNVISFEPSYYINFATTRYQFVNYPNNSYTTQNAALAVDLSLPTSFRWRVNYAYRYNPLTAPGFQQRTNLLNFSVTKRIQKNDRGEIGLVCYDLLDQNVSQAHYVVANTINDVENQVLKRYVLLTYTYHFNKFK
jgi:hypothetical protein